MTENFSNWIKINQIFPTNFSDICSRKHKILLIFHKIFLYFSKIFLIIYLKYSQNFQNILLKISWITMHKTILNKFFKNICCFKNFRRISTNIELQFQTGYTNIFLKKIPKFLKTFKNFLAGIIWKSFEVLGKFKSSKNFIKSFTIFEEISLKLWKFLKNSLKIRRKFFVQLVKFIKILRVKFVQSLQKMLRIF